MRLPSSSDPVFLDIETTGLDPKLHELAFVGLCGSDWISVFGPEQSRFLGTLDYSDSVLVTFNGDRFDLPFLSERGVEVKFKLHIDLMRVFMENWSCGRLISKDACAREVGIYVPRDPAGSGRFVAHLNERILSGRGSSRDVSLVMRHLANDLFVTRELFDFCVSEGWVVL